MSRFVLSLVLGLYAAGASAACNVAGTAFDASGQPMHDAVVRLVNLDTGLTAFSAADTRAMFAFSGINGDSGRYRLDILGPATVVTGTMIPTRSIIGKSDAFVCGGQAMRQDVRAQVY